MIYMIFAVTGALVFTVRLRSESSRIFYKYREIYVENVRLRHALGRKELEINSLLSPATINQKHKEQIKRQED